MATLVGIDSSTNFTEGRTLNTPSRVIFRAYTAAQSGTITALYAYMQQNAGSSATFKIGLWRVSDGALIASTAALTMPGTDGWVSGAASGSVVAGTDYYLGIMRNETAAGYPNDIYWYSYTTGAVGIEIYDSGTYPTVPTTISTGGGTILNGQLPIYADGTVGGGGSSEAPPRRVTLQMGPP